LGRADSILITDFDGTVTWIDFYALVAPQFLESDLPDYWSEYANGRITHFEAMRSIYGHIRTDEATLRETVRQMRPDPRLAECVDRLRSTGWEIEIVSAGCRWYIDQILAEAGVEATVHASPGTFHPDRGLVMELPVDNPYCSRETGVDKAAVVRDAVGRYERVAFAGDGRPDFDAALLVKPEDRFARGWLSQELKRRRQRRHHFEWWSEIAGRLCESA
jgi:2,3-diketo-5-methylthio-1-phosphopentane phosphatase